MKHVLLTILAVMKHSGVLLYHEAFYLQLIKFPMKPIQ